MIEVGQLQVGDGRISWSLGLLLFRLLIICILPMLLVGGVFADDSILNCHGVAGYIDNP